MTTLTTSTPHPSVTLAGLMAGTFTPMFQALARMRARHDLAKLDDHLLKDIGLTRADVTDPRARLFRSSRDLMVL